MASITLSELRTRCRTRTELPENYLTNTELDRFINAGIAALTDIIASCDGDHLIDAYTITTTTAARYDLPADFHQLRGVQLTLADSRVIPLKQFALPTYNNWRSAHVGSYRGHIVYEYRLYNRQLWLTPDPSAGLTLEVYYQPLPTTLSDPDDAIDFHNGFEEWVLLDVELACARKERVPAPHIDAERSRVEQRIRNACGRRDRGNAPQFTDIADLTGRKVY